MQENKEKLDVSPSQSEKVHAFNAWQELVLSKVEDVSVDHLVLFRDPVKLRLVTCKVIAVLPELERIAVSVCTGAVDQSQETQQYVKNIRCFVHYGFELVGKTCYPHDKAESIPRSIKDDLYNSTYMLCLVRLDIPTELRYEAARHLPVLHKTESNEDGKDVNIYCVFEIISGMVHYVKYEQMLDYDSTLASNKRSQANIFHIEFINN